MLVYGSSLAAYTAVEGLLNESVSADRIVMVQPHPPTCFNNSIVEDHVSKSLRNIGEMCNAKEYIASCHDNRCEINSRI